MRKIGLSVPPNYLQDLTKSADVEWSKPDVQKRLPVVREPDAKLVDIEPRWKDRVLSTPFPRHWPPNGGN
jgi:hypothetical protein